MERVSDKAQLRLRMSEQQILAQRATDKARAVFASGDRFFNDINRAVWEGTTRKSRETRAVGHWLYYAQLARDVAASKVERKHRKYWNKIARQYEEKAHAKHD